MPTHLFERSRRGEHALLIQPHAGGPPDEGALEEFTELARSAGATIAHVMPARIDRPNAATLLGSGKLEEGKAAADATGADLVQAAPAGASPAAGCLLPSRLAGEQ